MAWSYFKYSDRDSLKNLILEKEYCCMNFSTLFKKKYSNSFRNILTEEKEIIIHRSKDDKTIDFAITISPGKQLLFAAQNRNSSNLFQEDFKDIIQLLGNRLANINAIIGSKIAAESIIKILFSNNEITDGENSFNYYVMTLEKNDFIPCKPKYDIAIREAIITDITNIEGIQKNYEMEEVLPKNMAFNKALSQKNLLSVLKNQTTIIAEKAGKIIAKANTTSCGFIYAQIGGVYTMPKYRNNGISTSVVSFLAEKIFEKNLIPSLFVKIKNSAAIKVYQKLGFKVKEEFQIAYFFN
jgi:ribosomal protein S18 acetylase RimI-like enzyme